MKLLLTLILIFNFFFTSGQELSKENQLIISEFIDCVKENNIQKLSAKVSYPLRREYPISEIQNQQEFLKRYNEIFDANLINMITISNPLKDWSEMGWRGIMLNNGEVWLDFDGNLIAVNYQSEFEAMKKIQLIDEEKSNLHESIKEFQKPICILETAKFRIRIDEMSDGTYRYASWKLKSQMNEKPDIIINKGIYIAEGSGGNHTYEFKNGDYIYDCSIILLGEENSPPARLTVYKGEKEVLTQNASLKK